MSVIASNQITLVDYTDIFIQLSHEVIMVPIYSNGRAIDNGNQNITITIKDGNGTNLTSEATVTVSQGTIVNHTTYYTYTYSWSANSVVTATNCSITATVNGHTAVTTVVIQPVQQGRDGAAGAAAKSIRLSGEQIFTKDVNNNNTITPNQIILTAICEGGITPNKWQYYKNNTYIDISSGISQDNTTCTISSNSAENWATNGILRIRVEGSDSAYYDIMTIAILSNGLNGTNGTNGLNNATIYIYKKSSTKPTKPTSNAIYTFSTKTLTFNNTESWTQTIPAGTDILWMSFATASANTAQDNIAASEWSEPVQIEGKDGIDGYNQATIYLYQRSSTKPDKPNSNATYTFSTGVLSSVANWQRTIPTANTVLPCWVTTATAVSRDATDTIASSEWAEPVALTEKPAQVFLTNENISFIADANGNIINNMTFTSKLLGYIGAEKVEPILGTITGGIAGELTIDTSKNNKEYTITITAISGTDLNGEKGAISIPVTYPISTTLTINWIKIMNGSTGADAVVYELISSNDSIVKKEDNVFNPPYFTLDAKKITGTAIETYNGYYKVESYDGNIYTEINLNNNHYNIPTNCILLRCSLYTDVGRLNQVDQQTIPIISDGSSAYTVILTDENHSFAADTTHAYADSIEIEVEAYKGANKVLAILPSTITTPTGITYSKNNDGTSSTKAKFTISVDTNLETGGAITIPITIDGIVFNKVFTYTLSYTGATGNGVVGITEYYAKSSSGGTAPEKSNFSTTIPTLSKTERYMWNFERIAYTNGANVDTTPKVVSIYSEDGRSVISVVNYYLAIDESSGVTINTPGWSTNVSTQEIAPEKRFLWNYEVTNFSDGRSTTSAPHVVGVYGESGSSARYYSLIVSAQAIMKEVLETSDLSQYTVGNVGVTIVDTARISRESLQTETIDVYDPNNIFIYGYYQEGDVGRTPYASIFEVELSFDPMGKDWVRRYRSSRPEEVYRFLIAEPGITHIRISMYLEDGTTLIQQQILHVSQDAIAETREEYCLWNSNTIEPPTTNDSQSWQQDDVPWTETQPAYVINKYYWIRTIITTIFGTTEINGPYLVGGLNSIGKDAKDALAGVQRVETLANGKNKIYYSSSRPTTGYQINDMWYNTTTLDTYLCTATSGTSSDWTLINKKITGTVMEVNAQTGDINILAGKNATIAANGQLTLTGNNGLTIGSGSKIGVASGGTIDVASQGNLTVNSGGFIYVKDGNENAITMNNNGIALKGSSIKLVAANEQTGVSSIEITPSKFQIKSTANIDVKTNNLIIDTNANSTATMFGIGTGLNSSSPTYVLKYTIGNGLEISGKVTATDGQIGGWTINQNSLSSGSGTGYVGLSSDASSTYALWAGSSTASTAPFRVERDGSIVSTDGQIGGWTIDATSLHAGSDTKYIGLSSAATSTTSPVIWVGNAVANSAPFRVTSDGTVYLSRLITIDSEQHETVIDLRQYPLWKLNTDFLRSASVSNNTLTLTYFSGTVVNFSKAATFNYRWNGGQTGYTFEAQEVGVDGAQWLTLETLTPTPAGTGTSGTPLKNFNNDHKLGITVGASRLSGAPLFQWIVDATDEYTAGYEQGLIDGAGTVDFYLGRDGSWSDGTLRVRAYDTNTGAAISGKLYDVEVPAATSTNWSVPYYKPNGDYDILFTFVDRQYPFTFTPTEAFTAGRDDMKSKITGSWNGVIYNVYGDGSAITTASTSVSRSYSGATISFNNGDGNAIFSDTINVFHVPSNLDEFDSSHHHTVQLAWNSQQPFTSFVIDATPEYQDGVTYGTTTTTAQLTIDSWSKTNWVAGEQTITARNASMTSLGSITATIPTSIDAQSLSESYNTTGGFDMISFAVGGRNFNVSITSSDAYSKGYAAGASEGAEEAYTRGVSTGKAAIVLTTSNSWTNGRYTVYKHDDLTNTNLDSRTFEISATHTWSNTNNNLAVITVSDSGRGTVLTYNVDATDRYNAGWNAVTSSWNNQWSNGKAVVNVSAKTDTTSRNVEVTAPTVSKGVVQYSEGTYTIHLNVGGDTSQTITQSGSLAYTDGQNSVSVNKGSWSSGRITFSPSAGTGASKSVELSASSSWGTGDNINKATVTITDTGSGTVLTSIIDASERYSAGVTAGENGVTIVKGNWSGGQISFTKSAGTQNTKTVQLSAGSISWGTGTNVNIATIPILDGGGSTGYSVTVDASGRYNAGYNAVTGSWNGTWSSGQAIVAIPATTGNVSRNVTVTAPTVSKGVVSYDSDNNEYTIRLNVGGDTSQSIVQSGSLAYNAGYNTVIGSWDGTWSGGATVVTLPATTGGASRDVTVTMPDSASISTTLRSGTVSTYDISCTVGGQEYTDSFVATDAYNNGVSSVTATLTAAGWSGGSNIITAKRGSTSVTLGTLTLAAPTISYNSNNYVAAGKQYSITVDVGGANQTFTMSATEAYNAGWGDAVGSRSGNVVTYASSTVGTKTTETASAVTSASYYVPASAAQAIGLPAGGYYTRTADMYVKWT